MAAVPALCAPGGGAGFVVRAVFRPATAVTTAATNTTASDAMPTQASAARPNRCAPVPKTAGKRRATSKGSSSHAAKPQNPAGSTLRIVPWPWVPEHAAKPARCLGNRRAGISLRQRGQIHGAVQDQGAAGAEDKAAPGGVLPEAWSGQVAAGALGHLANDQGGEWHEGRGYISQARTVLKWAPELADAVLAGAQSLDCETCDCCGCVCGAPSPRRAGAAGNRPERALRQGALRQR